MLPTYDEVGLIEVQTRDVVFEPDVARGTAVLRVTWTGATESAGVADMEFLTDAGPLHIRLPVLALPPVDVGQALELTIVRPPDPGSTVEAQDDRIVLHDALTHGLLAYYVTQRDGGLTLTGIETLGLEDDGIALSRSVSCQGPERGGCNYQTEFFDLWFSAGGDPTILGQGDQGTLQHGSQAFRLMNRQALDNAGEAIAKGSCGGAGLAGAISFDLVLAPP